MRARAVFSRKQRCTFTDVGVRSKLARLAHSDIAEHSKGEPFCGGIRLWRLYIQAIEKKKRGEKEIMNEKKKFYANRAYSNI